MAQPDLKARRQHSPHISFGSTLNKRCNHAYNQPIPFSSLASAFCGQFAAQNKKRNCFSHLSDKVANLFGFSLNAKTWHKTQKKMWEQVRQTAATKPIGIRTSWNCALQPDKQATSTDRQTGGQTDRQTDGSTVRPVYQFRNSRSNTKT